MAVGVGSSPARAEAPPRSSARSVAPGRPQRRAWVLVVCLLSMVVCAGGFALVYLRSDSRAAVLAVSRPLAAGQEVTAADLRVVRVAAEGLVGLVPATRSAAVVGRTVAVPLAAGSLLVEAQLGPASWPPVGQAVVAVPVKSGRLAAGVAPGVRVLVIPEPATAAPGSADTAPTASPATDNPAAGTTQTPTPGATSQDRSQDQDRGTAAGRAVAATVVAVVQDSGGAASASVSLLVDSARVAELAAAGEDVSIAVARG